MVANFRLSDANIYYFYTDIKHDNLKRVITEHIKLKVLNDCCEIFTSILL